VLVVVVLPFDGRHQQIMTRMIISHLDRLTPQPL